MSGMQECKECGLVFSVVKAITEPKAEEKDNGVVVTARCDVTWASYCPHCGKEL